MAGVLNKLLSIAGFYEEPDYPQDNGYEDDTYYEEPAYADDVDYNGSTLNEKFRNQSGGRMGGGSFGGANASSKGSSGNTGNSNNTGASSSSGNPGGAGNSGSGGGGTGSANNIINFTPQRPQNYVLVSAKPDRLEDAQLVCNHLKDRHVVIVNVEGLEGREAQRIVDFISGSVYALDGEIFDITNRIFAVTPNYVELQSIQRDPKTRGFMSFGNSGGSSRG